MTDREPSSSEGGTEGGELENNKTGFDTESLVCWLPGEIRIMELVVRKGEAVNSVSPSQRDM